MVDTQDRTSVKYLDDAGLTIQFKKDLKDISKNPPKIRKRTFGNIDYLASSGLNNLTPELSKSFPSPLYDETIDSSYFEQCYHVLHRLGEGSFGFVLKVVSKEDNKPYALKLSKEPFRGDIDRSLRLKEVENHLLLSEHPNIVTLYDAWEEDRLLYMIMELCQNSLTQARGMSEEECWNLLVDVTLALDVIHEKGMGHFDVKLENILLGYDGLYKLTDFGLTFDVNHPQRKYPIEGDAKYLPPELLTKNKFSDKADIFSLGISVLELAGNLILPNHGEVWKALREDTFPRVATQHLSDELFFLLTRMMASDYSQRPSTKEILNTPRVKSILNQRRVYILTQPLCSPDDKLHYFILVWMIFYALVHLVKQQLLKERSDVMAVNTSFESEEKKIGFGQRRMFHSQIFTSTPCVNRSGVNTPGVSCMMNTGISEEIMDLSYSPSMRSSNSNESNLSAPYLFMSCDLSPIRLSRDIKLAIKHRSQQRKLQRKFARRRMRQESARKTLFTNNNESPVDEASSTNELHKKKKDKPSKRKRVAFNSLSSSQSEFEED